jgi:hypothetical protein
VEAGESQVQGQPKLHNETLPLETRQNKTPTITSPSLCPLAKQTGTYLSGVNYKYSFVLHG